MRLLRFFSRIVWRLLAFNLLLVIVPVSAVFFLDVYEKQLLKAQEDDMVQQGRILAAALADRGFLEQDTAQNLLKRLKGRMKSRLRIVDEQGNLLADSSALFQKKEITTPATEGYAEQRQPQGERPNWVYDLFLTPIRLFRDWYGPPKPELETADYYTFGKPLLGPEIKAALEGRYGATTRYAIGGQQSIILYSAIPIRSFNSVVGVVLVSQSTYRILVDLYEVRQGIVKVFLYSIFAAIVLSIVLSGTIARPLDKLRKEAEAVLDHSGRLTRHIRQTHRMDEIGDLSRSLTSLTSRLEQHLSFIESFAADISHEFKNPLASIRSATDIALMTDENRERIKFLKMIQKDVARMERLLTGAREITKIDASLAQESKEPVHMNTLCLHVAEAFKMRHRTIAFSLHIPEEPVTVPASPERIAQVLENIIDNAISFSEKNGTVELSLEQNNGNALVRVSDNGPGIPDEHREKIFERFFSFRQKNGGENQHTGLGLSIVKVIVESYDGSIGVYNRPQGGACFEVSFPVQ